jgi:APA family basic amino acid/polyamine antiporter
VALWVQAVLAGLLVLTGRFEQLIAYVAVVIFAFSSLTVSAVLRLRMLRPGALRPYRTPGCPLMPAAFVLLNLTVIGFMLSTRESRARALLGLVITVLGLPVLAWIRRRRSRRSASTPSPVSTW